MMTPLFRRTKRARAASSEPEQPALSEPHAAHDHATARAVPAGIELDYLVGDAPATRSRSKLRRRLRHLRKVRELLLRDLGGFVLEIHRTGADAQDRLVERKIARLAATDAEIAELEQLLDDRRPAILREPGIGGACLNCGELYGSSARFCWACGTAVAPGHGRRAVAPAASTGYAQLAPPAPAPPPQHPGEWIDSDAQALGDQPTEIMHPTEPVREQPTEAFEYRPERQTASFQAPAQPLPPPAGPSTVDLPVPPGLEPEADAEPHPADSLWNDAAPAPDTPPDVSPGDPLATRREPDA